MEALILGWYMLVETGSVLLLTVFGALLFAGTLVSPLFGVAGDRVGHRTVLCGMRAFYVAQAAALMMVALSGHLTPLLVLVFTGLMGLVRPSDLGVRVALTADIVPVGGLTTAMGISRTTSDSARVAGALTGAGIFALFGIGPAYIAIVCLYATGLALTLGIANVRARAHVDSGQIEILRSSAWRDLCEGVAHVWSSPQLLAATSLALLVNLTAFPMTHGLLPYVAKEIYQLDQTALGYLVGAFSFGALLGSLIVSLRETTRSALTMLVASAAWHVFLLVFAQMQSISGGIVLLLAAGFAQSFCIVSLTVLLLRTSREHFRGRVIGVRMLAIYTLPLGLLAAGALIGYIGFAATASIYAMTGLVFTALIALKWHADLWPSQVTAEAR
jgi:MFS family permease